MKLENDEVIMTTFMVLEKSKNVFEFISYLERTSSVYKYLDTQPKSLYVFDI